MDSKTTLSAIAAGVCLLVVGLIVLLWKQKKTGTYPSKCRADASAELPDEPQQQQQRSETVLRLDENTEDPVSESEHRSEEVTQVESLIKISAQVTDQGLKEFLQEIDARVEGVGLVLGGETPSDFVLDLVDRIDDLRAISKNHRNEAAEAIEIYRRQLESILTLCGAELLHSDQWDPEIQRAIAREPTEGLESPAILRFGSTGIRRYGELIRKQEVVLGIPPADS